MNDYSISIVCGQCSGIGYVADTVCPTCEGLGEVDPPLAQTSASSEAAPLKQESCD